MYIYITLCRYYILYIYYNICHPHSTMYYEPIKSWDRTTGHVDHHRHGALLLVICGLGSFGASWSEKSASGRMRKPENVGRPLEKNIGKTIEKP